MPGHHVISSNRLGLDSKSCSTLSFHDTKIFILLPYINHDASAWKTGWECVCEGHKTKTSWFYYRFINIFIFVKCWRFEPLCVIKVLSLQKLKENFLLYLSRYFLKFTIHILFVSNIKSLKEFSFGSCYKNGVRVGSQFKVSLITLFLFLVLLVKRILS